MCERVCQCIGEISLSMEITVQSKYFGIATVGEVLQQRRKITLRLPVPEWVNAKHSCPTGAEVNRAANNTLQ